MRFLLKLIGNSVENNFSILDLGGTEEFWIKTGLINNTNIHFTLLNIFEMNSSLPNIVCKKGDARYLNEFQDQSFDLVVSNSVIEHVGNLNDQILMAKEAQRVSKKYFIQTPNYFFPFEPHFFFIGFQFLPILIKIFLIRHFNLGHYSKTSDYNKAKEIANSIRLMKKNELKKLFPEAKIVREKFLFFTKSFFVYNGF